jgi:glycosyltransferase involved in cell wall biosynthesis
MRVLYILPAEEFGGAERQGVLHIANLPRTGIQVLAAVGPGKPVCEQLLHAGVSDYVFCRDFPDRGIEARSLGASLFRPTRYLRSWWKSVRALTRLGREGVDLVFASRTFGWTVGSVVARRLGVPVIWRAGSQPSGRAQLFALRRLAPLIAPDLVVTNSEIGRRCYAAALRVSTAVLPNAVDTRRFSLSRTTPRLRRLLGLGSVPVVGLAARPAPDKGLDCFAEVARDIAGRLPTARFLVAGENPWRPHFQRRFAALGLGKQVSFLGHVEDIENFYASCDVVVLTSGHGTMEMSSNAILEAMATERPVVVTDVGGMSETIMDGVNGFIVPPDAPEVFARRVAVLLDNHALRKRIGATARSWVVERHSLPRVTHALGSLLNVIHLGRQSGAAGASSCQSPREAVS